MKLKFIFALFFLIPLPSVAQYGAVNDLGSGNAGVRIAAFDGRANVDINGSNRGRVSDGDVSDVITVSIGNVSFSGGGRSVSRTLEAGKVYLVAYVGGSPVGVYALTNEETARSESSVVLINGTSSTASFSANGNSIGSVRSGGIQIFALPPSRTVFSAGGQESGRVSLRRGRVSTIILTNQGIFDAS